MVILYLRLYIYHIYIRSWSSSSSSIFYLYIYILYTHRLFTRILFISLPRSFFRSFGLVFIRFRVHSLPCTDTHTHIDYFSSLLLFFLTAFSLNFSLFFFKLSHVLFARVGKSLIALLVPPHRKFVLFVPYMSLFSYRPCWVLTNSNDDVQQEGPGIRFEFCLPNHDPHLTRLFP